MRKAARLIADAVLHGARDRGCYVRSAVDQRQRSAPLTRLRASRPARTPQVVASRRGDKVNA